MKKTIKLIGIIALVAVIWFSMAACDIDENNDDNGTPTTQSLNGVWASNIGTLITVSGSTGVLSALGTPSGLWGDAINKGYLKIGEQYWKNLTSTGNLTWSGQVLLFNVNTSNPDVALNVHWSDCTFTMSSDGITLQRYAPSSMTPSATYTRK